MEDSRDGHTACTPTRGATGGPAMNVTIHINALAAILAPLRMLFETDENGESQQTSRLRL